MQSDQIMKLEGQIKGLESEKVNLLDQVAKFETQISSMSQELTNKCLNIEEKESKVLEMVQQIEELKVTYNGQIHTLLGHICILTPIF